MSRTAMDPVDAAWLRMDNPDNRMTIISVMTFDRPFATAELKTLIGERLLRFPRFKRRVTYTAGRPFWEDDTDFDLDRHVESVVLPDPGDVHALQAYAGQIMGEGLPEDRPLWSFHVIEHFGSGSAIVGRLHHCIADGMALVQVLLSLADGAETEDDETGESEASPDVFQSIIDTTGMILGEGIDMVLNPDRLFDRTKQGIGMAAALAKFAVVGNDAETRLRGPLGKRKAVSWSKSRPLPAVKAAARRRQVTVNDLLLTALAGGIRRYLLAYGDVPEAMEIRAIVPVNLRRRNQPFRLGNRFGLVMLSLPVGRADAAARCRIVHERMEVLKESMEPVAAFGILQVMGISPSIIERGIVRALSASSTAVMTNVPGPKERLTFVGREMTHVMFWVPRAGSIGLGISILSYADEVLLGFATDAGLVPDPDRLVEAYTDELEALLEP